jgi:molecular chaperone DnaJ
MVKRDYYIVLGVSRSESPAGIHEAFRRLAKKYHPDLGGPATTDTFQEIAQAYEILSDPAQRKRYDETLRARENLTRPAPAEPLFRQRGYEPEPLVPKPMSIPHDFQTIRPSFDALFDRVLRNFTGIGVTKAERPEDLNIEVILTPMEVTRGVVTPIEVPVFQTCWSCQGTGRQWLFPCTGCAGQGMIEEHQTISVRIPPGVRDRSIIELPIEGLGIHNFYLRLHIRILG